MAVGPNNDVPVYYSLTFAAALEVGKFRSGAGEGLDKVFRIITSEVAFLGLALFGAIETVVRSILSLIAKGIHFCIPEGSCKWFFEYIYAPSVLGAAFSGLGTGMAATMLVANFMDDQDIEETLGKVAETWASTLGFFEGMVKAQLC